MDASERIGKLEVVLPTLASKEDVANLRTELHREFNLQTWRIVGAIIAAGGLLVAGLKLIP